jgi:hypothetical protein
MEQQQYPQVRRSEEGNQLRVLLPRCWGMFTLLELVLDALLVLAGVLDKKGQVVNLTPAANDAWRLIGRRFPHIRGMSRGADIVSHIVNRGGAALAMQLLPAAALQGYLGHTETQDGGDSAEVRRQALFADLWAAVGAAGGEVERLMVLARRHTELAVLAVTRGRGGGRLLTRSARDSWLRQFGRNPAERSRLVDMLERMGCGCGAAEPRRELMFCLRHSMDLRSRIRAVSVPSSASRVVTHCANKLVRTWLNRMERAAASESRADAKASQKACSAHGRGQPLLLDVSNQPHSAAVRRRATKGKPGPSTRRKRAAPAAGDGAPASKRQAKRGDDGAGERFVELVQSIMVDQGISQTALASQTGLTQQKISRWCGAPRAAARTPQSSAASVLSDTYCGGSICRL